MTSNVTTVVLFAGIMKFPGLLLRHDYVNSSAHTEEIREEDWETLSQLNNVNLLRTVLFIQTNWCQVLREMYLDTGEH